MSFISTDLPRPRWNIIIFTGALHVAALLALLPQYFSWQAVGVAVFLHWLTIGLGISLGFHRLATHRSFKTSKGLEYFLILCGSLAGQGAVLGWVGYHRAHHLYVDTARDPHDSTQGFWWSHISWLMHEVPAKPELPRLTQDISGDRVYRFCHRYYVELQVVLGILLYALGGMPFVVWGIFVRLFAGFHATCLVNSACHMIGYRNFETKDQSTNNWWVALVTYGEGWHNNHHAHQHSARYGLRWWEIDMTWMTLQLLQALKLVTHVKVANPD
jgi:sn-1 stearoyl-lipid 9-desaturase